MTTEQVNLLKERVSRSVGQWQNEMIGLAIIGSIISIIGGIYTINMVIRPLNKLVNLCRPRKDEQNLCPNLNQIPRSNNLPLLLLHSLLNSIKPLTTQTTIKI